MRIELGDVLRLRPTIGYCVREVDRHVPEVMLYQVVDALGYYNANNYYSLVNSSLINKFN